MSHWCRSTRREGGRSSNRLLLAIDDCHNKSDDFDRDFGDNVHLLGSVRLVDVVLVVVRPCHDAHGKNRNSNEKGRRTHG
jgi:hypothetical protein